MARSRPCPSATASTATTSPKPKGSANLWRAVDWEPMEISAVAMPADPGAHIRGADPRPETLTPCLLTRADAPAPSPNQTRTTMPETQTPEARSARPRNPRRARRPAPAADPSPDAIRTEANRSAAEVLALCERHALGAGFAADLIRRGLSLDAARAAILDKLAEADAPAARGSEPVAATARGTGAADAAYRDAMSEALLHRHNPGRAQLTDRAREFRGLTLLELARHALDRRGIATRGLSKMELATEALIGRSGLHSTSDFPLILANVANKTLRAAYDTTPRTFTAWARQAVITDFKPVARNQLGGAPDLLRVPESGEFTYGTIGESREVYALVTYGRIVGITRQTLINDDLDAFTRIPSAFGAAAADLESDLVYSIFSTNPNMADGNPLFHASHANLGTAGTISETTLAEAYRLFGNQRGPGGPPDQRPAALHHHPAGRPVGRGAQERHRHHPQRGRRGQRLRQPAGTDRGGAPDPRRRARPLVPCRRSLADRHDRVRLSRRPAGRLHRDPLRLRGGRHRDQGPPRLRRQGHRLARPLPQRGRLTPHSEGEP
jgi:hypothetical protein